MTDLPAAAEPVLDAGPELASHLHDRTPLRFGHLLVDHPQLQLESVAGLAERLPQDKITCEAAVKPLVVPTGAPVSDLASRAAEVIRHLDEHQSWMTLLNIETDGEYSRVVDELVDSLARNAGLPGTALFRRMGFVFASSPNSVTPAHFDIEHNVLIQLRGHRTLSFGRWADLASRDREVHRYWNGSGSFGRLESMPPHDLDVQLAPGVACYIPPYTPHWVQNGPASSLSLTLTFFTRSNEVESLAQAFNERVAGLGLRPRRAGEVAWRDGAKARLMRGYSALRGKNGG